MRLERESTPELWDDLQAWFDADPRNRVAFIRLRTVWNRCDKLKMLRPADGTIDADLLTKIEFVDSDDEPKKGRRAALGQRLRDLPVRDWIDLPRRRWLVGAVSASVAVLVACIAVYGNTWQEYRTDIGGRKTILLSDGSTVEINTDSDLRVRMSNSRRDLTLKRGEALFHVAHDTGRPFYVVAGGTVVRAVGTAFSVRVHEDNRVEVLVTEGRVAVGTPDNLDQPTLPASAETISRGEAASAAHSKLSSRRMHAEDMARKLAWTTGRLSFQGESLTEAVGEFNRYNRRHLSIADPSITLRQVGGNFRATDPDSFVAALELSFGVQALRTSDGSGITLKAAPPDAQPTPVYSPTGIFSPRESQHVQDSVDR